nr:hypothetical protein [Tanacetum cinerariifolium]
MLVTMGEGSGTPTEPHHTPFPEAQQTSPSATSSPSLPPVITPSIPTVIPSDTPQLRQYTRRARVAQSLALPPVADEPASPIGDDSQGKACPTDSGLAAEQDRANIIKTSTLPSDSTPRVTSLALLHPFKLLPLLKQLSSGNIPGEPGLLSPLFLQPATIDKSSTLPHDLAPRVTSPAAVEGTQEVEINRLKEIVKQLEEREGSRDDAPIKVRSMNEGEAATERVSDDTEEMATVLTSIDAATVLASRVVDVPTGSGSIPTASTLAEGSVPTGSEEVPTASPVFATTTMVTPVTRRKGKEVMMEFETPKK